MSFMLNSSFSIAFFFCARGSGFDSAGVAVRIVGKEGDNSQFTFEVDALLGVGRLGEVKYDAFDSLFKGG